MAAENPGGGVTRVIAAHPFHFISAISGPSGFEGISSGPQMWTSGLQRKSKRFIHCDRECQGGPDPMAGYQTVRHCGSQRR